MIKNPKVDVAVVEADEFASGEQPLSLEQRRLVDLAYNRFEIWRDACKPYHEKAKVARAVLRMMDPQQDPEDAKVKTLQLQTLKSTFNFSVADQMDNMPEARMLPERPDLAAVAEDLTDVTTWVMNRNAFESKHRMRVEDCFGVGTAVTQIAWDPDMDYGEGNIAILRWPVEAFLWDPAAETLQEARALFKVSWHPRSWYKQHYPDVYKYIGAEDGQFHGVGVPEAMEDARNGSDEEKAMLLEYWFRLYDAKTRRYTINVAYLAGGALLDYAENVYAHGLYPFVGDVYSKIEGTPVGDGMVDELVTMMRYINRYGAYIDMNLRMSAKGRLLVDRAAGIDMEALADWTNDIIPGDRIDASALQWLQTQPFTGMVTQQMIQLQTDLKQDSGQNQFTRGETTGGVTAASAISSLQEAGGKVSRLRTHGLNQGFKEIVEQVMWLISQFYDDERVIYITGRPDKENREVKISRKVIYGNKLPRGKALPPPPFSVQVQVQRRNPLRVQAQNELFMQMYSMAAQGGQIFPLSVLLELLQVDGKERILPVVRESETYAQQMQQLAAQNEQLMAENQQLQEGIANLQSLNQTYAKSLRNGMYPSAGVTDQALPDVQPELTM